VAPDSLPDPIAVAVSFARLLERLDIPYVIGGSLASSLHGEPRSTNDIDVVADVRADNVAPLVRELQRDHYVDPDVVGAAVRSGGTFNVIQISGAVKIDVFVVGDDQFDAERLRHRERVRVSTDPPADVFIDSAEHTILRKLEWYRRGGETSERQWRDVIGILRIQGLRLDRVRLETWAARLGISDLLSAATREAHSMK
jgi:hypothetical protein